ncbi:MAG: hypothetical protein EKK48_12075 [Candidatus Melainabacteria bacterium]|nr:MAG: hypothetical protein EKK48_12075 [Candidatus Melainabacteria bacterium]
MNRIRLKQTDAAELSERDLNVLAHFALPASVAAKVLDLRVSTFRKYTEDVVQKLGAPSKACAILIAIRSKVLVPEEFVLPASLDGFEFDKFED